MRPKPNSRFPFSTIRSIIFIQRSSLNSHPPLNLTLQKSKLVFSLSLCLPYLTTTLTLYFLFKRLFSLLLPQKTKIHQHFKSLYLPSPNTTQERSEYLITFTKHNLENQWIRLRQCCATEETRRPKRR